jgi:hypothetical protein
MSQWTLVKYGKMQTQSLDDVLTDAMAVLTTIRVVALALEPHYEAAENPDKAIRDWRNLRSAVTGGTVRMVNAIQALREKPTWEHILGEVAEVPRSVVCNLVPGQADLIVEFSPLHPLWLNTLLDPERQQDQELRARLLEARDNVPVQDVEEAPVQPIAAHIQWANPPVLGPEEAEEACEAKPEEEANELRPIRRQPSEAITIPGSTPPVTSGAASK